MIIITERNVEIFEIEAQYYAEWRVQFRQTLTLIQKRRRRRKKLFSPQGYFEVLSDWKDVFQISD